jgi:SAM-dependent methyltransferase
MPQHPPAHESLPDAPVPSAWIERWTRGLAPGSRVLDFASGYGRNIRPLLEQGASVLAVDRDRRAVESIDPRATAVVADLEGGPWPFERACFDVVIVGNYLFRPRFDLLADLLAPGGRLVYETFAVGNARYGRPSNPAFLLASGELARGAERAGLVTIAYEHGYRATPGPALVQRLCAVRPPFEPECFRLDPLVG